MKKIKILPVFFYVNVLMALIGCKKEGAVGPTGPTGPSGPQGPEGTANVIYSTWEKVSSFGPIIDTVLIDYNTCKRWIRYVPALKPGILDSGLLISYWKIGTVVYSSIPYQFMSGGDIYYLGSIPRLGKIIYFTSVFGASPSKGWTPNSTAELRYIIIPGGVKAGFKARVGGTIYTAGQIGAMSYQQVCGLFNIPAAGQQLAGWE